MVEPLSLLVLDPNVEHDRASTRQEGMRECRFHEATPDTLVLEALVDVEAPQRRFRAKRIGHSRNTKLYVPGENLRCLGQQEHVVSQRACKGRGRELLLDVCLQIIRRKGAAERSHVRLDGDC